MGRCETYPSFSSTAKPTVTGLGRHPLESISRQLRTHEILAIVAQTIKTRTLPIGGAAMMRLVRIECPCHPSSFLFSKRGLGCPEPPTSLAAFPKERPKNYEKRSERKAVHGRKNDVSKVHESPNSAFEPVRPTVSLIRYKLLGAVM